MSDFHLSQDISLSDNIFDELLNDLEFENFEDLADLDFNPSDIQNDHFSSAVGALPSSNTNDLLLESPLTDLTGYDSSLSMGAFSFDNIYSDAVSSSTQPRHKRKSEAKTSSQHAKARSEEIRAITERRVHSVVKEEPHALLLFPVLLFKAFNAGDMATVRDLVLKYTESGVRFRTPALDKDVVGKYSGYRYGLMYGYGYGCG
ncbi:hypothetical protein EON64_16575 [archaeon]|nr:MAG: hypothetical protein EON64_16575 [archaeon]